MTQIKKLRKNFKFFLKKMRSQGKKSKNKREPPAEEEMLLKPSTKRKVLQKSGAIAMRTRSDLFLYNLSNLNYRQR